MNYSEEVIKAWLENCYDMGLSISYALSKCKNEQFVEDVKDYLYLYDVVY